MYLIMLRSVKNNYFWVRSKLGHLGVIQKVRNVCSSIVIKQ